MAALARRDPDAFWDQVGQLALMLEAGTVPPGMRWVTYGGHAMLMGP